MSSRPGYSGQGTPTATLLTAAPTPFALGYFLSYLFRAVNAVVGLRFGCRTRPRRRPSWGLLTSAYLFAFALFELPWRPA